LKPFYISWITTWHSP